MTVKIPSSLTETTYLALRAQLLQGNFGSEGKLKIAEIARMMLASPSVVREALSRLVSEGLVLAEPQRGFRVAPVVLSEIQHLFEARIEIERLCLADAIEHGDLVWEGRILAALHELSRTEEERGERGPNVSDAWRDTHANFHAALVSGGRNHWYQRMRINLYVHSERYRALALSRGTADRDLHAEHEQIARAAIDRDAQSACALMTLHLKRTINEFRLDPKAAANGKT
jgi:DNA-binding GntR family transcriptional regulator